MISKMSGSIAISKAVLLRRRVDSRMHTGNTARSTIRTSTSNLSNRWKSCISVQALAVSSVKEKDWKKSVSVNQAGALPLATPENREGVLLDFKKRFSISIVILIQSVLCIVFCKYCRTHFGRVDNLTAHLKGKGVCG